MDEFNEKEFQIMKLIAKGYSNSEISEEMFISIHTVKVYISSILHKLNAKNRTEAAFIAGKNNLVN